MVSYFPRTAITIGTNNFNSITKYLKEMRTYGHILLTLLSLVFFNQVASGQEREDQSVLVGTWTLDYDATFAKRESRMKALMDTIPQSQRSSIEDSYKGRTMSFGSDGGFRLSFPDGRNMEGTWSLDQGRMTLLVTDPSKQIHVHWIKELKERVMVLRLEDSGGSKLFVKELYFVKN